jgi:hypothetical protein
MKTLFHHRSSDPLDIGRNGIGFGSLTNLAHPREISSNPFFRATESNPFDASFNEIIFIKERSIVIVFLSAIRDSLCSPLSNDHTHFFLEFPPKFKFRLGDMRLPTEIWIKIVSYLDGNSLRKISQVCSRWYQISNDRNMWERVCKLNGFTPLIQELG